MGKMLKGPFSNILYHTLSISYNMIMIIITKILTLTQHTPPSAITQTRLTKINNTHHKNANNIILATRLLYHSSVQKKLAMSVLEYACCLACLHYLIDVFHHFQKAILFKTLHNPLGRPFLWTLLLHRVRNLVGLNEKSKRLLRRQTKLITKSNFPKQVVQLQ